MTKMRDWQRNRELWVRVLEKHTGEGLAAWNRKIGTHPFGDERQLRRWLSKQGVTGYAQQLLVMERFGYPDFVLATADDLIGKQYADRPQLRAIYDRIIEAAHSCGEVIVQARKTVRIARLSAPDVCAGPSHHENTGRSRTAP